MTALSARRRHRLAAPAVLLLALLAMGSVYAALAGNGTAEAAPQTSAFQVDEGRQLFLEGCASCHGLNAEGSTDGPSLVGVGAAAVDFQVGTGRMPLSVSSIGAQAPEKPVDYTQEQINALAAYVASLGPGPAIPTEEMLETSDADLQEGGELFRTNCASCHNFSGQGGALTNGKWAPPLTKTSPKHIYEAMVTGPGAMPVFGDQALSPEHKQDIIRFVDHIRAEPNAGGLGIGRVGPVSEGLVSWVVGIGALVVAAVWLATKAS